MVTKMDGVFTIIWEIQHAAEKHGNQRCRDCGHTFEENEAYVYLATSVRKWYGCYYSKFCLPCVNRMLIRDEDRVNEELDREQQREIERKRAEFATRQR